jgi:hypothetical protein
LLKFLEDVTVDLGGQVLRIRFTSLILMEEATSARPTPGGYTLEAESLGRGHEGDQIRKGLPRTSRPPYRSDDGVEGGFQGAKENPADYVTRVGGRIGTVSSGGTGARKMSSWKIVTALFLVGTTFWVGAAVYAVHIRQQTSNENCKAIKQLRSDLVQVLENYRNKSPNPTSIKLHKQAIGLVSNPHCEVK